MDAVPLNGGAVLPTPSVPCVRTRPPKSCSVNAVSRTSCPFISAATWRSLISTGFFSGSVNGRSVVFTSLELAVAFATPQDGALHFYPRAPQGNGQTEVRDLREFERRRPSLGGYFHLRLTCRSFSSTGLASGRAIGRSDVVMLDEAAVTVARPLVAVPSR